MKTISGILKIRDAKNNRKIHELHYTKANGKPGCLELKENIQAYANGENGDPAQVEMEGGVVIRAIIPGKEAPPPCQGTTKCPQGKEEDASGPRFRDDLPKAGTAPYNFTPYAPDRIVRPCGEPRKWSGEIICRLEALTPLLVSGRQLKKEGVPTICRFMALEGKPVIPGTSLKGMLRSLMEILSFSGMRPMNRGKLYWREVVGSKYRDNFPEALQGGLLRKRGAEYTITPTEIARKKKGDRAWIEAEVGFAPKKDNDRFYYFKKAPISYKPRPIDAAIVAQLWEQLTPDQEKRWDKEKRAARLAGDGLPVFYRGKKGEPLELGFCRYFRLAYKYTPFELAWPAKDKKEREEALAVVDFAENIFGHVRKGQAQAGRVAITSCQLQGVETQPQTTVLGGPKPTCLGFYITQDGKNLKDTKDHQKYYRSSMKSYNDANARLRGRKLYWHHDVHVAPPPNGNKDVAQLLLPLEKGAAGEFAIIVKNLSDSELGCLFEALELLPQCAHKLGMGKPLGFGSVKITIKKAAIAESRQKYASLGARLKPASGEGMDAPQREALRAIFRASILRAVGRDDYYSLPQIRSLYRMLNYENRPDWDDVRYMTLKEYSNNLLLPTPAWVLGKAGKLEVVDKNIKKPRG